LWGNKRFSFPQRADSRVLVGPPSPQVFLSVSDDQLVRLLIASLRWHLGDAAERPEDEYASWTDDAVLNSCRAWQRLRTGHWFSKTEAGAQLLAERVTQAGRPVDGDLVLDSAVIEQALAARTGGTPPSVRLARKFQRQILSGLELIELRRPG